MATGTAVATTGMNKGVAYVDPARMNTAKAKKYLAKQASGARAPFIGTQIRPNGQDGAFAVGFGDTGKTKDTLKLVMNVPQSLSVWQYWPEEEKPTYPYIFPIFGEGELPSRDACGPEETKFNKFSKQDEDVWKEGIILILRDPKSNEMYHLMCFGTVSMSAAAEFVLGIAEEPEIAKGMLPLVELNFERVKSKKGNFYKMVFDVIEWVKATKHDTPDTLAKTHAKQEQDAEADAKAKRELDDEDEAPRRGREKSTMSPKDKKDLDRARRTAEDAETEDEDEDQAKGNGSRRDPRNNPPSADDVDEAPRRGRRAAVARDDEDEEETPRRGRRAAPVEDEDDDKPVVRRRKNDADDEEEAESRASVRRRMN